MTDPTTHFKLRSELATKEPSYLFAQSINNWFKGVGPTAIYKTCATCQFMRQHGSAFCEKVNMTPPVAVIMTGCEAYRDVKLAGAPNYNPEQENFDWKKQADLDGDIPF